MTTEIIAIADELYANGDAGSALEKYYDALFQVEPDAALFQKIAHCNKILGDDENAREYYEKSLELDPENFESLYNYGESLANLGEHELAIEAFDRVIQQASATGGDIAVLAESAKKKSSSVLLNRAGGALMKEGNLDAAYESFIKAIELDPQDRRNYLNIGVIFINRGDLLSAIEWMGKALRIDPHYIRGYYNLATLHLKAGHYRRAIDVFNQALRIEPGHPDCEDIVTNLYVAQDKLDSSEEALVPVLRGDQIQINMENVKELANALLPDQIESVDIAITNGGEYRMIAHSADAHYEVVLEDGELKIRMLEN